MNQKIIIDQFENLANKVLEVLEINGDDKNTVMKNLMQTFFVNITTIFLSDEEISSSMKTFFSKEDSSLEKLSEFLESKQEGYQSAFVAAQNKTLQDFVAKFKDLDSQKTVVLKTIFEQE